MLGALLGALGVDFQSQRVCAARGSSSHLALNGPPCLEALPAVPAPPVWLAGQYPPLAPSGLKFCPPSHLRVRGRPWGQNLTCGEGLEHLMPSLFHGKAALGPRCFLPPMMKWLSFAFLGLRLIPTCHGSQTGNNCFISMAFKGRMATTPRNHGYPEGTTPAHLSIWAFLPSALA